MRFAPILFVLSLVLPASADIPTAIPHQGRIAVDGVNFDGSGQFKFLLFGDEDADHNSGNELGIWSNSTTTPSDMAEPTTAVTVQVTKGLYSLWLGDTTVTNMATLPSEFDPSDKQLYLRTWFNDGTNGFQQLSGDQPIGSVAYALLAAKAVFAVGAGLAQSVEAGSVGSAQIANGSIQAIDIAAGAVGSTEIADGSIASGDIMAGAVTTAGLADDAVNQDKLAPGAASVLASEGDPADQRVAVQGNGSVVLGDHADTAAPAPVLVPLDFDGSNLDFPTEVVVLGDFAYAVDGNTDLIQIFNVADPNNIVPEDSDSTNMSNPVALAVEGDFAYVIDSNNDLLQVFNISDPSLIAALGSIAIGSSPVDVAVQDQIVYVVDDTTGTLEIYDATDPNTILAKGSTGSNLAGPTALAVDGDFAYVVDEDTDRLQIFDVSDVNNILVMDNDQTNMSRPKDIAVGGDFAYVVFGQFLFPAGLQVFDVSDKTSVAPRDSDGTNLQTPSKIAVESGFAYVVDNNGLLLSYEVSNPLQVVPRDFVRYGDFGGRALAVAGDFAYLGDARLGRLQIFGITPTAGIAGSLSVSGKSSFSSISLSEELVFPDGSIQTSAATNQQLSLAGNTLSISDGNDVNLASIDDQTISLAGDTLSIAGGNSADFSQYLRDDGSEPLSGNLTVTGTATASAHKLPSAQNFTFSVPGSSLIPSRENEDFFHSSLGYVRLEGTDTIFLGTASVTLPQGAVITGYDLMYYDNSSTQSFTSFTTRLRRRGHLSSLTENIAVLDVTSPSSPNNTSIVLASDNPGIFVPGRATVDNNNFAYHLSIDMRQTGTDSSNLRCYGFRVKYTLDTLLP